MSNDSFLNFDLFRKEAVASYKNRITGVVLLSPTISQIFLSSSIFVFSIVIMTFLCFASYSENKKVTGWLEPDAGLISLYGPTSGQIEDIYVKPGQEVSAGEPLITIGGIDQHIENSSLDTEQEKFYEKQIALMLDKKISIENENKLSVDTLSDNIRLSKQSIEMVGDRRKNALSRRANVLDKHERRKTLHDKGFVNDIEYAASWDEVLRVEDEIKSIDENIATLKNSIDRYVNDIETTKQTANSKINDLDIQINSVNKSLMELKVNHRYIVKSPVDGIITNINLEKGQFVAQNTSVMVIWPKSSKLIAKLLIPVSSSGLIETKQSVKLQYDAFPYRRFGLHDATIKLIGENTILPSEMQKFPVGSEGPAYIIEAELDSDSIFAYGRNIMLKPGMTLSADINVGSRTLYEWIFDPLLVLSERI